MPRKWITDMAGSNFNGLAMVYGEEVLEDIIGCEYHYQASVSERSRKLQDDDASQFKLLATTLLEASTTNAYSVAYLKLKEFIEAHADLKPWLQWWHERRKNVSSIHWAR